MKAIWPVCLALVTCPAAVADVPWIDGKIKEMNFETSWDGPGSEPPSAGHAAGDYAELISDYNSTGCMSTWPGVMMYPCNDAIVHTNADYGGPADGRASCELGFVDVNGYCTGEMVITVRLIYVNDQSLWCHEMGHTMGASHDNGYIGCMDTVGYTIYSSHHRNEHLQFVNGPPH